MYRPLSGATGVLVAASLPKDRLRIGDGIRQENAGKSLVSGTNRGESPRVYALLPRIRLHDLRHTHATIALQAGVPVKVIAERLGHEDPAFTMKQYAHVIPGMQANAARLIADTVDTPTPNNAQHHPHTPTNHTDAAAPNGAAFDTGLT